MSTEQISDAGVEDPTSRNHTHSRNRSTMASEKTVSQHPRRTSRLGGEGNLTGGSVTDKGQPFEAAANSFEAAANSNAALDGFLLSILRSAAGAAPDHFLLAAVAQHGRVFRHVNRFPSELSKGLPSQSEANCMRALLQKHEGRYYYAEGFVLHLGTLTLFYHSWLVNDFGEAIDITRTDTRDTVFVGIAVKTRCLLSVLQETKRYGFITPEALQTPSLRLQENLGMALIEGFSDRRWSLASRSKVGKKRFMLPEPNDHMTTSLLSQLMAGDLRDRVITPAMTAKQLKARYLGVYDKGALTMMMQEACRLYEGLVGALMIVIDGESGQIVRSFDCPVDIARHDTKTVESIAVASINRAMDLEPEDDENAYRDRQGLILHVYSMPVGSYPKRAGNLVKAYGRHILTYQVWNKEFEDIEAPFPHDNLTLFPASSYIFTPARGYQGYDGMNWRSD
tara:strand:+ start:5880 stop:7235 length:1356 start_codon:yes stop_codon:yes gene_type:complete